MPLIKTIKSDQVTARKLKNSSEAALLTTLIGEAEMIGKSDGNRETTDAETVALVKKFIKNIDEILANVHQGSEHYASATVEKTLLSKYLPKQLTEVEVRALLTSMIEEHCISFGQQKPKMGVLMQRLKAEHEGTYDGAIASKLAKELLA